MFCQERLNAETDEEQLHIFEQREAVGVKMNRAARDRCIGGEEGAEQMFLGGEPGGERPLPEQARIDERRAAPTSQPALLCGERHEQKQDDCESHA